MKGIVKMFNADKGFGFIATNKGDVFSHISNVLDLKLKPERGLDVEFDLVKGQKGNQATNIKALENLESVCARSNIPTFFVCNDVRIKSSNIKQYGLISGGLKIEKERSCYFNHHTVLDYDKWYNEQIAWRSYTYPDREQYQEYVKRTEYVNKQVRVNLEMLKKYPDYKVLYVLTYQKELFIFVPEMIQEISKDYYDHEGATLSELIRFVPEHKSYKVYEVGNLDLEQKVLELDNVVNNSAVPRIQGGQYGNSGKQSVFICNDVRIKRSNIKQYGLVSGGLKIKKERSCYFNHHTVLDYDKWYNEQIAWRSYTYPDREQYQEYVKRTEYVNKQVRVNLEMLKKYPDYKVLYVLTYQKELFIFVPEMIQEISKDYYDHEGATLSELIRFVPEHKSYKVYEVGNLDLEQKVFELDNF